MNRKYLVYKYTSPDGKVYIGCTSEDVDIRWGKGYCHNSDLRSDIKKFGKDNFKREILASDLTEEDAYNMEQELIHKYRTIDSDSIYNISNGGKGNPGYHHTHTDEAKRKIREASLGRHHTEEAKKKLSDARKGEGNPMYGKHPSEETRRKLSESHMGKFIRNRKKYIDTHRKRIMCIETGKIYESIGDAAKDTGWSTSYISSVCSGKRSATGPYHWRCID